MYSQRDEERVIRQRFGARQGRVLDIGAYDGKTFSNTLALIERGWGGTLVEASPGPFRAMMRLHKDRPNLNLVLACIGHRTGVHKFHASDDAVGTDSDDHYETWKEIGGFVTIHTPVITPHDLLAAMPGPYEFVSIDVEGFTTEYVFRNLPYYTMGTELVCVEHNGGRGVQRFAEIGEAMGLRVIHTTGENHIMEVVR